MNQVKTDAADKVIIRGMPFVPIIDSETIQRRVRELAEEIADEIGEEGAVFVCVLNGGFMFFSDFVRNFGTNCEIAFIQLSSYGENATSSGVVRLVMDVNRDIQGRRVYIIEDIVDTGASIDFLRKHLEKKNPASLKIVTLLYKPESISFDIVLDYVGFEIPSRFVIGYGLDYAQKGRNLTSIYIHNDN